MPWHKPRFRLSELAALVALVAAELAILPKSISPGIVLMTCLTAVLASARGPLKRVERIVIILVYIALLSEIVPAIQRSQSPVGRARPVATSGPESGKI